MPEEIKSQDTPIAAPQTELSPEDDFGFGTVSTPPQTELSPEDDFGFATPDPEDISLSPMGEAIQDEADEAQASKERHPWIDAAKRGVLQAVASPLMGPAAAMALAQHDTYTFQAGFNQSLMGMAYDVITGNEAFDLSKFEDQGPETKIGQVTQEVAAITMGFLFDAPLFLVGGAAGKGAMMLATRTGLAKGMAYGGFNLLRKGLTKLGVKAALAEDMIASGATKNSKLLLNLAQKAPAAAEGIAGSAGALGMYNTLGETLTQMTEQDIPLREVERRQVMKEGVIGMKMGIALGTIGIGGKYLESVMAKGIMGPVLGGLGAEGIALGAEIGIFGAGDAFLRDESISNVDWGHVLKMVGGARTAGFVQRPGAATSKYGKLFEKSKAFEDPARRTEFDAELTALEQDMVEGYRPEGEIGSFSKKLGDKAFVNMMADENIPWITKSKLLYERTGEYAKITPEINNVEIFKSEEGYGIKAYQVDPDGSKMLVDAVRSNTKGEAEKAARFLDKEAVDIGKHREFEKLSLADKETVSNGTMDAGMNLDKVLDAWETRPEARSAEQESLMRKFYNTWNESLNPPEGKERPKPTTVEGAPEAPLEAPAEQAPDKTTKLKTRLEDPEIQKKIEELPEDSQARLKPGEVTDEIFETEVLGMNKVTGRLEKTGEGKYKLTDSELTESEGRAVEFATEHERTALHEKFDAEIRAAKEEQEIRKFSEPSHSRYKIGRRGYGNKEAFLEALRTLPEEGVEGVMDAIEFPTKETSFSEVSDAMKKTSGKKAIDLTPEEKYSFMGDADIAADIKRNERRKWRIDQAEIRKTEIKPETKPTLTEETQKQLQIDEAGDVTLYHWGPKEIEGGLLQPGRHGTAKGAKDITANEGRGQVEFYVKPEDFERTVITGRTPYTVKVPANKLYDFNADPKGYVTDRTGEPWRQYLEASRKAYLDGYQGIVSDWRGSKRVDILEPIKPRELRSQSELHKETGGSTFMYAGKQGGKPGFIDMSRVKTETPFVIGETGEVIKGKEITDEQIQEFKDKHLAEMQERYDKGEKLGVGTWYDEKTDQTYIDLVNFIKTKEEALKLGEKYEQEAIYNLETEETTYIAKEREAEARAKERAAVEKETKPERESLVKAWEDEFKAYEDTPAQKIAKAEARGRKMSQQQAKEIRGKLEQFLADNRQRFDRLKIPARTRTLRQINNISPGAHGWNQVERIKNDLTKMIQDAEYRAEKQQVEKFINSIQKEVDPKSMTEYTGKGPGKRKAKRSYFNPLSGYQRIEKFETLSGIVEEGLTNPEFRAKAYDEMKRIEERAEKRMRDRERGEEVPMDTDANGYTLDDAVLKEQLDYATLAFKGSKELKFMLDNIKELKKTDRMASERLREEWKKDKDRRRDLMFKYGARKGEEPQIGSEKKKPKTRHPLKVTGDMSFKSYLSTLASRRDLAGDKAVVFDDPINREFIPGISKAEEQHAKDRAEVTKSKQEMMNDAYELTGYKEAKRKNLGMDNRIQKPDVLDIDLGDGSMKKLPLSQYEAGHLWLTLQQEGAEATFRKPFKEHGMGWTDKTFEQLESFLDPQTKKLAEKLRDSMNKYKEARVDPVYRMENGVSLGSLDNYWPFIREAGEFSKASSDIMDKQSYHTRVTSDHHIERSRSTDPFVYMDMMQVYDKYMQDQLHYANWAETVRRLDETFKDPKVRAMITQHHGSNYVDVADWFIDRFAGKTIQDTWIPLDTAIRRMSKGILYLNRAVGWKQTISSIMYMLDMDPYHWGTGMTKMMFTPEGYDLKSYLKKQPFVADRGYAPLDADQNFIRKRASYKYTDNVLKQAGQRMRVNLQRAFNLIPAEKIDQIASSNIKYNDRFPILNAGGAYIMDKMRKAGTSWSKINKDAEKLAKENNTTKEAELDNLMQPFLEKWTLMSEATQQSTRISNISRWRTGHPLNRSIAMFTSGAGQIHRVATQSLDLAFQAAKQGNGAAFAIHAKNFMLSHVLMGVMYNLAQNGLMLDPEEKAGKNELVWAAALGNTHGLAYFGRMVDLVSSVVRKEPWADKATMSPIVGMMKNISTELIRASDYHKAGEIDKRNDELVKLGQHLAQLTGVPARQIFDVVEDVKAVATGETDKPLRQVMGLYDPDYDSGVEIHEMFDADAWEEARQEEKAVEKGRRQGLTGAQVKKFREENK